MPCTLYEDVHKIGRKKIHVEWKMAKIRMFLCRYTFSTMPYVCIEITLTLRSQYKIGTCSIHSRLSAICMMLVVKMELVKNK